MGILCLRLGRMAGRKAVSSMKHFLPIACIASALSGIAFTLTTITLLEPITVCKTRVQYRVWAIERFVGKNKQTPVHAWITKSRVVIGTWTTEEGISVCQVNLDAPENSSSTRPSI